MGLLMGKRWNCKGPFVYQQAKWPKSSSPPHYHSQEESYIGTLPQLQLPHTITPLCLLLLPFLHFTTASLPPEGQCEWAWTQTGLGFRCWQTLGTKTRTLFQFDCPEKGAGRRLPREATKAVLLLSVA